VIAWGTAPRATQTGISTIGLIVFLLGIRSLVGVGAVAC
jgi:hypothetical protein